MKNVEKAEKKFNKDTYKQMAYLNEKE